MKWPLALVVASVPLALIIALTSGGEATANRIVATCGGASSVIQVDAGASVILPRFLRRLIAACAHAGGGSIGVALDFEVPPEVTANERMEGST